MKYYDFSGDNVTYTGKIPFIFFSIIMLFLFSAGIFFFKYHSLTSLFIRYNILLSFLLFSALFFHRIITNIIFFISSITALTLFISYGFELQFFLVFCIYFLLFFQSVKIINKKIQNINNEQIKFQISIKRLDEELNSTAADIAVLKDKTSGLTKKINRYNSLNKILFELSKFENYEEMLKHFLKLLELEFGADIKKTIKVSQCEILSSDLFITATPEKNNKIGFDAIDYSIMEKNSPVISNSLKNDYRFGNAADNTGDIQSIIIAPIIYKNKSIGVVRLESAKTHIFTLELLRLLDYFETIMFNNLQNILLFKKSVKLAERDGMTGLYKRWFFDKTIQNETQRAARYKSKLSLIMMDVDDFRNFNNNYGHLIGDKILSILGAIIRDNIPVASTEHRYGGEEIAIILPETDISTAADLAEKLCLKIRQTVRIPGIDEIVTVSIGVAEFTIIPEKNHECFIKCADDALYKAKKNGKDRFIVYEANL